MFEHVMKKPGWLDWNLRSKGQAAGEFERYLVGLVREAFQFKRFHRRKYSIVITCLVANLLKSLGWVKYSRDRNFPPPGVGMDVLVRTITTLEGEGLLKTRRGYYDRVLCTGELSEIRVTPKLSEMFSNLKKSGADVVSFQSPELIVCRDFTDSKVAEPHCVVESRNSLLAFNSLMARSIVQTHDDTDLVGQYLCRIFNNNWGQGGRLYRGTWQNMKGASRRRLRINGSNVVELDYGELHIRMLLADENVEFHGDAYSIGEIDRKLMKTAVLVAINAGTFAAAKRALHQKMNHSEIPRTHSPDELIDAFEKQHPELRKYLCSGVGLELQCRDSELILQVLADMTQANILALPVHDSLLVAEEHETALRQSMTQAYVDALGVEPKIEAKYRYSDSDNQGGR